MIYIQIIKLDTTYFLANSEQELPRNGVNDLYTKINICNEESYKYLYTYLNNIENKQLVLNGVKEFKKEEVKYLVEKKLSEYLYARNNNYHYYEMQEKALLNYNLTKQSNCLSRIANKKQIEVTELVELIKTKIDEHNNVIFNFKHVIIELNNAIDKMDMDHLHDLNLNDYLEQVLYKKNHDLIDNFETISLETISVEKKLDGRLEESKLVTDSDQLVDQLADDINEKKKGKLRLFKK